MESLKTPVLRPPHPRGQGMVEAILTLPVFLILMFALIQLFLLSVAQVQIRYAAFCAARVGSVRNADVKEMEAAVGKVLFQAPGPLTIPKGSYRVEVLSHLKNGEEITGKNRNQSPELLKIRVHWNFPLLIPFLNAPWVGLSSRHLTSGTGTVPLKASWTTVKFEKIPETTDGAEKSRK